MPSLSTLLIAGWAFSAAVAFGWHVVDKSYAVNDAWATARRQCETAIKQIETATKEAADKRLGEALDAAAKVEPTPETDAELEKLCHRDPNCRTRPD
jgi:hypothetical protein